MQNGTFVLTSSSGSRFGSQLFTMPVEAQSFLEGCVVGRRVSVGDTFLLIPGDWESQSAHPNAEIDAAIAAFRITQTPGQIAVQQIEPEELMLDCE